MDDKEIALMDELYNRLKQAWFSTGENLDPQAVIRAAKYAIDRFTQEYGSK